MQMALSIVKNITVAISHP